MGAILPVLSFLPVLQPRTRFPSILPDSNVTQGSPASLSPTRRPGNRRRVRQRQSPSTVSVSTHSRVGGRGR